MSTFFADPAMSAALWIVVKASLLLGIVASAHTLLLQRASAALRHLVLTLAVVGLLLLPALSLALPYWPVVVIRTAAMTPADVAAPAGRVGEPAESDRPSASAEAVANAAPFAQSDAGLSASTVIAGLYVAGVLVMLLPLGMQWRNVRRLAREGSGVDDSEWARLFNECAAAIRIHRPVRLLRSARCSMPMTWGTSRPAVLIPAMAESWAENRRRAVILHELAHVARYDCLTQTLASAACAVFWFHPGAWWIARRLRIERELACDDRVLAAGTQAREYASHLLEIAYAAGNRRAPALAVSMAGPRQLESRMLAALDSGRNRSVPAMWVRLSGAAISIVLLVPLAAARPAVVAVDTWEPAVAAATASAVPAEDLASEPHSKPVEGLLTETSGQIARAVSAAIRIAQENLPGTWEIRPTSTQGTVHLRLMEVNSSSGSDIPVERLEGLTAAQLAGTGGPVQFRLRRDAGTFTFDGVLRSGVGAGTFSFTPDPNFPGELAKRGFSRPTEREQYQMARHDVGYAFVDELNKQGYSKPQTSDLVRAGQHGVSVTYVREMGALGYRLGSLEPLIKLRDHGVAPDYVRALEQEGYKQLSADQLLHARDHGITPDYVRAMREGGYGSLPMADLVTARDHGVTPEFVRELGDAGHRKLPLEQLIQVRDHGVTPEYVRDLRQLGHGLPLDEVVRARDHGVTPEYARAMRDAGQSSLTMEQLINARDHGVDMEMVRTMATLGYGSVPLQALVRLRDHGVTPKYVQDLKALGYDRVPIDDLVTLRDHGVTPERIAAANARAGTRLPLDMIKSLAAGGMR